MSNKGLLQQRVDEGIKLVEKGGLYDVSDYTKDGLLAVAYSVHCGGDENSIVNIDPTIYPELVLLILASQDHNPRIGTITIDEVDLLIGQYGEHAVFVINLLVVSRNPDSGYSELELSESDPLPINAVLASTLVDDPLLTAGLTMYGDSVSIVLHDLAEHIFNPGIVEFAGINLEEEETIIDSPEESGEMKEEVESDDAGDEVESGEEVDNIKNYPEHVDIYNYIDKHGKYDVNNYSSEQLGYLTVCVALGHDLDKMLELDPTETSVVSMIYYSACNHSGDLAYNPLPNYVRDSIEMQLLVITLSDDPRGSEVREMLDNGVPTDEIAETLASNSIVLSRIAEDYPDVIFSVVSAILTLPLSHPLRVLEIAISELDDPLPPLPDKYRDINAKEVLSCYCDKEDTTH